MSKKAIAKIDFEKQQARIICSYCGFHKEKQTRLSFLGAELQIHTAADFYFDSKLWLQAPFKSDRFFAYNLAHLEYIEHYIFASLR